jgi:hypothetical protein
MERVMNRRGFLKSTALALGAAPLGMGADQGIRLPDLDAGGFWTFQKFLGAGSATVQGGGKEAVLFFESSGHEGMAASFRSSLIVVEPSREYIISYEIRTHDFEAITARLAGGVYVHFQDANNRFGAFAPTGESVAPRNTEWKTRTVTVTVPTTARTMELHLAYAAYGTWVGGHPMVTGRARGQLWVRHLSVRPGKSVTPLRVTIQIPDTKIQSALDIAANCLHNSQLGGQFTVSDGYTISGNIVPDLSFGLFGVRRLAHPDYLALLRKHWEQVSSTMDAEGRITSQRVMSQVFFPLGVDEIVSFSGDRYFLARYLPLADRCLDFLARRADGNGLVRLVEYKQWHIGEGADWVDWYPTRMEGKTLMFHLWYVHALRRLAALHTEFAGRPGSADRAAAYRERSDLVVDAMRRLYWREDHFVTNIDYGGNLADETWLDDQVWAIRFGVATPEQAARIWKWIDRDTGRFEGVPTRWAAFEGPTHGPLSWFGRNGAGDILARYRTGNADRGLALIRRISEIFARDGNIYEAYNMAGEVVPGTQGWGNYTEHCGGFIWSVAEGIFGLRFESDGEAAASLEPAFPRDWSAASIDFYIRGTRCHLEHSSIPAGRRLLVSAIGPAQPVRIRLPGKEASVHLIGAGTTVDLTY